MSPRNILTEKPSNPIKALRYELSSDGEWVKVIKQDVLAVVIGTTQPTLSKIENDELEPGCEIIFNVISNFDLNIDQVLIMTGYFKDLEVEK